jgi:parallel beta-helix repeat protein
MKGRMIVRMFLIAFALIGIRASNAAWSISDNATGGDCTSIGTWNNTTKTCTLTAGVTQPITMDSNSIILDGAGYGLTGSGTGDGVYLSGRSNVTVRNLIVSDFNRGFYVKNSAGILLADNKVSGTWRGIVLDGSSNNLVAGNTASNNTTGGDSAGILVGGSSNQNMVLNNNASYNGSTGIWIYGSNGNYVIKNLTVSNKFGFFVDNGGRYNLIASNTATKQDCSGCCGIRLAFSSNENTVTDNAMSENYYGFHLWSSSSGNQIYHNNFIANKTQAFHDGTGTGNKFNINKPAGGNFWSDWMSPDYDRDGFVDNPYVFTGGQDDLPWTLPNAWRLGNWGDVPVPADYDGDSKNDIATWRPSTGYWYILPSGSPGTFIQRYWGMPGDIPVPGDYDGDGVGDIAMWRPSNGFWYILPSASPGTFLAVQWGVFSDTPVPRDYDGDGKTDFAIYRQSDGCWYIVPSASPGTYTVTHWGSSPDLPLASLTRILSFFP